MQLLANAPTFFTPFMKLLLTVWGQDKGIRSTDWQVIVLRTASLLDAPYVWAVNEPAARIFGFGDTKLQYLRSGDLSSKELFTDQQRLVSQMVDEMVRRDKVTEPTMMKAKEILGDDGTMEVMITHGVYALLAKVMNSAKIDYDPPIPGLEEILTKYSANAIETENSYKD